MMEKQLLIGTWHETEVRNIQRGTSYAADYINHETVVGDYPVYLIYEEFVAEYHGGVTIVNAKELMYVLPTNIVSGKLFSGFCGNNFGPGTDVATGPSQLTIRPYAYMARDMVKTGHLELLPEFSFLADPYDMVTKDYLEYKRIGLYRYLGLDPYWMKDSPQWQADFIKNVDAMNSNSGDWNGYDIGVIETGYKLGLAYASVGKPNRIELTWEGEQIRKKLAG